MAVTSSGSPSPAGRPAAGGSARIEAGSSEHSQPRHFGAEAIASILTWPVAVAAMAKGFRVGCALPPRHHHTMNRTGHPDGTLLLMPAWTVDPPSFLGVKVATILPGPATATSGAVQATYHLSDGASGLPLATLDGGELTMRRTAATSALAATKLARSDSRRLLIVGTGRLAPYLALAHFSVLPIERVEVWGRSSVKAKSMAARLLEVGLPARPVDDLEAACRGADVISCATLSEEPLVRGDWLAPGTHLDLVGGFTPSMREADDDAISRARVFVDTENAALEAGDLVQPLAKGHLNHSDIQADLFQLCARSDAHPGRIDEDEITAFKSVGTALEDLFAAIAVWNGRQSVVATTP